MAFIMKQNDTRPVYDVTLFDQIGEAAQAPINLVNATAVKFIMRAPGSATPKVNAAMTVQSAADGVCRYVWVAVNTADVGTYQVEFEITWNDGGVETVPNGGYMEVVIVDDLG